MRSAKFLSGILCLPGVWVLAQQVSAQTKRIVIAANTILDGKGRVLRNTRIVLEGAKIVALDPRAGPVDYDLRGLTVLPGWIDAHVHITWSFGADGGAALRRQRDGSSDRHRHCLTAHPCGAAGLLASGAARDEG
ncbi:MAG: hypothetical protein ACREA2_24390 [Blastocatellia bacterium]